MDEPLRDCCFCTISTVSHLHKTAALRDSLVRHNNAVLHVLLVDDVSNANLFGLQVFHTHDLSHPLAAAICSKYRQHPDKLRWSLKPCVIQHLLNTHRAVIYLDNDFFCTGNASELFEKLSDHSMMLTPHHYDANPGHHPDWLEATLRLGVFNAGFIGASRTAISLLEWWASCCLHRCEKNFYRGLYDDQKYLDLLPAMDEHVHILRHTGCNVAGWNSRTLPRSMSNGQLLLKGRYPLLFVHFNYFTIRMILDGNDELLVPVWQDYLKMLNIYSPGLKPENMYVPPSLIERLRLFLSKLINRVL